MRLLRFALGVAFASAASIVPYAYAGNPYAQSTAPSEPTLQETIQWIQTHLILLVHNEENTRVQVDLKHKPPREVSRINHGWVHSISSVKFDACTMNVVVQSRSDYGTVMTYQSKIPLDRMTGAALKTIDLPSRVSASGDTKLTYSPSTYFSLTIESLHKTILVNEQDLNPRDPSENYSTSNLRDFANFVTDDEEMGSRLAQALNHAINLCQITSKPEPF